MGLADRGVEQTPRGSAAPASATLGAIWNATQRWYAKVLSLVTVAVLARLLDPADFGVVALCMVFVGIGSVLAELGLAPMIIRAPSLTQAQLSSLFWLCLAVGLTLGGAICLASAALSAALGEPSLAQPLLALAAVVPINALCVVQASLLTRDLRMRALAIRGGLSATVGALAGISVAFGGGGVWSLVAQSLVAGVVGAAAIWVASDWRPSMEFEFRFVRSVLADGSVLVGTQLVNQLRERGDELVIGFVLGPHALGIWVIAVRITSVLVELFAGVVGTVALPALARVAGDMHRFARVATTAVRRLAFLVWPVLGALVVVSPDLVPGVFGEQWGVSGDLARILTMGALISAVSWLDSSFWLSLGKFRVELFFAVFVAAVQLAAVLIAAPHGLMAIAWAVFARAALVVPIRALAVLSWTPLSLTVYRSLPRSGLCTVAAMGAVWATSEIPGLSGLANAMVAGATGLGAYALLSFALQRSTVRDMMLIVRRGGVEKGA